MSEDAVKAVGEFEIARVEADGSLTTLVKKENLVVALGKEAIADQLAAAPTLGAPKYLAVGKSGTEPKAENTALGEEIKRKEATTRTRTGNVLTMAVEFPAGDGTGAWQEAGVLTSSSGGTLYSRTTFGVVTKEAGDAYVVTWKLTVA